MVNGISVEKVVLRLSEFLNKGEDSNIYNFFKSILEEYDDFVFNKEQMQRAIFISTAEGSEIDQIGQLFKLPREIDETDEQYRSRILGYWIGVDGSTDSAIKNAVSQMTGTPVDEVVITQLQPLRFKVDIDVGDKLSLFSSVSTFINEIKAVGTEALFSVEASYTDTFATQETTAIEILAGITRVYGYFTYGDEDSTY